MKGTPAETPTRDKGRLRQYIHKRKIRGVETAGKHSRSKLDIMR